MDYRPATSKSRGTCRYYTAPHGCFAGDKCKFTHADPHQVAAATLPILTPYDRAKKCKHYAAGFCKRGDSCWFIHVNGLPKKPELEEDELCSICFEKPVTFGLLAGCSHVFCVKCIRQWRDPAGKAGDMVESGNTKRCPMCRSSSRFITPSSRFWKDGQEGKLKAVKAYKESMARVPCRHFQESKTKNPTKPMCPFGRDCFYQHLNDDGSKHVFKNGVDVSMRVYRRRATLNSFGIGLPFESNLPPSEGLDDAVIVGNIALGMLSHLTETARNLAVEGAGRGGANATGVDDARRGLEERDEISFDQARIQMVAGIAALRAELSRLEQSDDAVRSAFNHAFNRRDRNGRGRGRGRARVQMRPMVIPGTLAPQAWDLDGMDGMDGDGMRNGLGWNDMFSEVDEDLADREVDAMERLEIIAGQMLSSYQDVNTSRADLITIPPPLDPMHTPDEHEHGRSEGPPPPPARWLDALEQDAGSTNGDRSDNEGDDDLPSLRSVSSSNDSQDGHADHQNLDIGQEVDHQWPLFHYLNGTIQTSEASITASASRISDETSTTPAASSSSRFSTVVDREETQMIIGIDDDNSENKGEVEVDEVESEDDVDSELIVTLGAPTSTPLEPPFVTDGRGRVVWSSPAANKAIDHGDTHEHTAHITPPSHPTDAPCSPSPSSAPPPPPTIQLHDAFRVLPNDGFTTDGRGRVINIGSNDEEFQPNFVSVLPTPAPSRSFLGRVFDALF